MSDYVVWMHDVVKKACGLQRMFGYDDDYLLDMGVSVEKDWPADVQMEMDKRNKGDKALTDALFNVSSYLVVSEKLKAVLEAENIANTELLPVGIRDFSDTCIPEKYFLLNFSEHLPHLDLEASTATMSAMLPGEVMSVKGIVLKDTTELNAKMFRLKGFVKPTLVRRDVAEKLNGFSGIRWAELSSMKDKIW